MIRRLLRLLGIASDLAPLLPLLGPFGALAGGVVAGVIAYSRKVGLPVSLLVALFVIYATLQSITSIIYLYDRLSAHRQQIEAENRELHYQVRPAQPAVMILDESNEAAEFQLRIPLLNNFAYPVRYLVTMARATIDDRVTPDAKPNYVTGILPTNESTQIRLNSYRRGHLARTGLLRGKVEIRFRYGLASRDFVFESRRVYDVKCDLSPNASRPPSFPKQAFPVELIVVSEHDEVLPSAQKIAARPIAEL